MWKKIRSGVLFGVACITSPCCTPLLVPLLIGLLAGTPAAAWITQNVGWVYGLLTLLSVISFVLALRWMGKQSTSKSSLVRSLETPVPSSYKEKTYVEQSN